MLIFAVLADDFFITWCASILSIIIVLAMGWVFISQPHTIYITPELLDNYTTEVTDDGYIHFVIPNLLTTEGIFKVAGSFKPTE